MAAHSNITATVQFRDLTTGNLPDLKRLNSVIFPITYNVREREAGRSADMD